MENNFGEFLKSKRKEKNLSQKELANLLFVSESAVSKWEKNVAHPDISLLPTLAKILNVTEHELITASTDKELQKEKLQAKKWRVFSFSWSLFFYISYAITILTCFICNLAIEKSLSWFWIVVSALILAFTFTNLPKIIKKNRLLILPVSMFLSLCLLLAVCCGYTNGNWFWVASFSVLLSLIMVFIPIYIVEYKVFDRIKKYNAFISVAIDFIAIIMLLAIVNNYTIVNYQTENWFFTIALPIACVCYFILNLFLCVKFLKTNKLIKTSVVLFLINILYIGLSFIKVKNPNIQHELDNINIFKANFSLWQADVTIANNVHCIIFLTILILAISFLVFGVMKYIKNKK